MEQKGMLVSITADTSRIERKLTTLLEMFPEHISDEFLSMLTGLSGNIIFADGLPAVSTCGAFDIIYSLDFDSAAYDEVVAAARAFKGNIIHQ